MRRSWSSRWSPMQHRSHRLRLTTDSSWRCTSRPSRPTFPDETPYDAGRGLQRFSVWLDEQEETDP